MNNVPAPAQPVSQPVWNNTSLLVSSGFAQPQEVIHLEDSDDSAPAPAAQPVLNNVTRVAAPPVLHDVVDLAHSSSDR